MGEFRIDHATIAFRLALAEASEQEQARVDALMALWQRSVFAATWPSPNEAPRTLTNSHGETALPLFSGLDTLEVGADRFSWREANGSIRYREMPAHEALRYALTRQVNFVVLDVGFEHNVEFAREEFEPLIAQREPSPSASAAVLDAIRRNSRPPTASPPPASAPPDPASLRAQVAAQPPSTRAVPGASRPAAPSAAQAPAPLSGGPDRPSGAPTAASPQAQARSRSAAASPRSSHAAIPQRRTTAPWPQYPSEPAGPPQPQAAAPQPEPQRAVTPPPARPTSAAVPAQPEAAPPQRTATPAPARPTTAAVPVQPGAASAQRAATSAPARTTTAAVPVQPEAAAPQRAATPAPARPTTASVPVQPTAANINAQPPPKPQSGAVLRQSSQPPSLPRYPSPLPTVPPPRAAGEMRRTPPPVPEAARSRTPSTPGVKAPISDGPLSLPTSEPKLPEARRRTRDDEPTLAERPNRANTQRGLQVTVPDTALEALSSELQGFPEVEWACVLVDESDVPLIGVRIDPSFLNRVADITDVILDVGERQSVTLQVLLLNNQDLIKNARRNGRAFYPWSAAAR